MEEKNIHLKKYMYMCREGFRYHILTLGPLALAGGPQVEQGRALLQQRVRILHTDLIDVIYAELKLTCQLCIDNETEKFN